jgi:hypothetical protein
MFLTKLEEEFNALKVLAEIHSLQIHVAFAAD